MVGLTSKQKDELNAAIHEYLLKNKFTHSAELFAEEANVGHAGQGKTSALGNGLITNVLEKKWSSLAKLKK